MSSAFDCFVFFLLMVCLSSFLVDVFESFHDSKQNPALVPPATSSHFQAAPKATVHHCSPTADLLISAEATQPRPSPRRFPR